MTYMVDGVAVDPSQSQADSIAFTLSCVDSEEQKRKVYREQRKHALRREAEAAYRQSVTLPDGTIWNGGIDAAIKIDGAVRLAENAGLTEVTLYDIDNAEHVMTIADGKAVASAIASEYQRKLAAKQAAFRELGAIDLSADDARAQIDAVTLNL
ncbi:hypothetical protein EQG41_18345 [Billgrantia azerbaijanica]|nr:hypothetical protein EQG41_18345 [Halomonas azerbaijanica]